jgi:hypothetical protein
MSFATHMPCVPTLGLPSQISWGKKQSMLLIKQAALPQVYQKAGAKEIWAWTKLAE